MEVEAMRRLVLPDDAMLRGVYGSDLDFDAIDDKGRVGRSAKRTLRLRLRRAEARGLLPRRVYTSKVRFGYWLDQLEPKLAALPIDHAATLAATTVA
jgi:hypothetical protein